jgi:hypothetical protein
VFVDLRAVVDGHVPAAEVHHAGIEREVSGVEGRVLKFGHRGLGSQKQKRPCIDFTGGFGFSGCGFDPARAKSQMQHAKPKPRGGSKHDPSVLGT